jgi:hypothetical protein
MGCQSIEPVRAFYMLSIEFQYYPARVDTNKPVGVTNLSQLLRTTKNPPQQTLSVFKQIEQAEIEGNKKLKAELKQNNLYYFTPCVVVNGYRRYVNINYFTGLMVIDFDHIDNAAELKEALFTNYQCIIASWLSPSRRGVKCIVRIPVVTSVNEFKEYYFGMSSELNYIDGFDSSGQNCVLPLFQSYDQNLLYRRDAQIWDIKGGKSEDFTKKHTLKPNIEPDEKSKAIVIKIIDKGFDNITDFGHPPLRSLCLSIGGYIASGYIDRFDALNTVDWYIENHSYLKKGIEGYKKTARWAIDHGMSKPLTLGR